MMLFLCVPMHALANIGFYCSTAYGSLTVIVALVWKNLCSSLLVCESCMIFFPFLYCMHGANYLVFVFVNFCTD